jgi:type IV pilus assembly protein PilA
VLNLAKLRQDRADKGEDGFTLIELLVVVVIIGILIAIAIPLYLNYKKGANDKAAQSDLRNAIATLETCNSDNSAYPTAVTFTSGTATPCTGQTINTTSGTTLTYFGTAAGYALKAFASGGNTTTTKYYCYTSAAGGSVVQSSATFPTAGTGVAGFTC